MASSLKQTIIRERHWVEWCCHTNYSFLAGASFPKDYVERASDLSYSGVGVCDFDGVYGLAKSFIAQKNLRQSSLFDDLKSGSSVEKICDRNLVKVPKIFYGTEIHLNQDHHLPVVMRNTVILYALSRNGYKIICRLLTKLHEKGKYDGYFGVEELVSWFKESPTDFSELVCILPMRGVLLDFEYELHNEQVEVFKDIFGERCYQALSPSMHPGNDQWVNEYLEIARKHGLKILLSQDAFFCSSEDKVMSDLQQAIRENISLDEASGYIFSNDERSLKATSEIYARFKRYDFFEEAIKNSIELAGEFSFCFSELSYHYPQELIPEGYTSYEWLKKKTYDQAHLFYKGDVPESVRGILLKELNLIKELGFADYFLTVADIVAWARTQGILCQGRGSAANSAICFVLGVTSVDPSQFDVLFERFISAERGDPPDIDVDFEHERREEVISYIYERYGRNRAAMVANVITFKTRGALRASGKALGIPTLILDEAAKFLGRYSNRGEGLDVIVRNFINEFSESYPDTDESEFLQNDLIVKFWIKLTKKLKGYPRHLGIHSGGFMISHLPIENLSPIEPATKEGRSVVQWDKDDIEALGFFKVDILALGMLTAIRKTFDVLKSHYGKEFSLASIPSEDKKTYDMISRAETVGVFQIESRAQMTMLPRLRPKTFYDLVIEVAIIRPGPIQGGLIHPFLKRRDGIEPVIYPHKKLEPILKRTLGVPIFQEQVMRIAMAVGGFSPGEADELRRKMGAWQIKGDLSGLLGKLEKGMRKEGMQEKFIVQTMKQLDAFSAYGFPESHAASFALLAYVSSYLKCHHPDAFFVSLLNSMPMGFYSAHTLLRELKKERIEIRRVCVVSSDYDHLLEVKKHTPVASEYGDLLKDEKPFAVRLGFRLVRGLSKSGAELLVQERKRRQQEGRPWRSMDEFMSGRFLDRGDLVALAASDAFLVFGIDRRQAIWKAHAASLSPHILERENTLELRRENPKEKIDADFNSFETSLYSHPVDLVKLHYWEYKQSQSSLVDSRAIRFEQDRKRIKVFGLVITRQAPPTAKGMMFVTLEDASGFINLAVRPEVYSEYASLFDREIFLLAEGVLQKNGEVHSLMVKKLYERSEHLAKVVEIENDIFKEVEHDKKNGTTDLSDFKKDGNSFSKKRKQEASSSHRRHPRDVPRFAIRNFH